MHKLYAQRFCHPEGFSHITPRKIKQVFLLKKAFVSLLDSGHTFRDTELENVAKMLSCGTPARGSLNYHCQNPNCTHTKTIYLTCKSRFCNSCGQKATEQWIAHQGEILPDCSYRHITFTMPHLLWGVFEKNRQLLGSLFALAARPILQDAKHKKLTVGFFAALHTYGRQLNFNTHIHLSLADYGLNTHGDLKRFHLNWAGISEPWKYGVIQLLHQNMRQLWLPSHFPNKQALREYLDQLYHRYWNVDIAKTTTHKNQTKNYIGRYLKKPPIAASRLKHIYAGDVTFEYLDHYDKKHKRLTLTQEEMLLRLLSHIPEKHFKMVRYFGFLSNRLRGTLLPIIYQKLGQQLAGIKPLSFTAMMKAMLRTDPFECILCGCRMTLESFDKGIPLSELRDGLRRMALGLPIW